LTDSRRWGNGIDLAGAHSLIRPSTAASHPDALTRHHSEMID